MLPIPLIFRQGHVSGHAEGIRRSALGIAQPISPLAFLSDGGGALTHGFSYVLLAVTGSPQAQGDHGVQLFTAGWEYPHYY